MITLGSSWIYELQDTGEHVANCHKVPADSFHKRLLSVKEILASFESLISLQAIKDKHILFTISPVRYVRDGLVENNFSKAVLFRVIHDLVEQYPNVYYFPAYEIVIDELRDYRYFENDFSHPNKLAIDYVWERFVETVPDKESREIISRMTALKQSISHRPIHPDDPAHQHFRAQQLDKLKVLKKEFPFLNLEEEFRFFKNDSASPAD